MSLKELKSKIDGLAKLDGQLDNFKDSWIKQIKKNTNPHFPFLSALNQQAKRKVNGHLNQSQKIFQELNSAAFINEKLSSLAKYLIELKLAHFQGEKKKSELLAKKFIGDKFLNLKGLVDEVNQAGFNLKNLKENYDLVNKHLAEELSLENSVVFMSADHKKHLDLLLKNSRQQKKYLKLIGSEFISLVKKNNRKSGRRKR